MGGQHGEVKSLDPALSGTDWAGVQPRFFDGFGRERTVDADVIEAMHVAMGIEGPPVPPATIVMIAGSPPRSVPGGSMVVLEDGSEVERAGGHPNPTVRGDGSWQLPVDLPVGYHRLVDEQGVGRPLLVSPGRCYLPPDLRVWGVTAQLYAARRSTSWGIGDLGDLAVLVEWAQSRGAGLVGLNPLHAPTPSPSPPNSPYSPSTRRWLDPMLIDLDTVPGFADLADAGRWRSEGVALNHQTDSRGWLTIDRSAVWAVKRGALEAVWAATKDRPSIEFHQFCRRGGAPLERWGAFCTIADGLGQPDWSRWPAELQRPQTDAVRRVVDAESDRVRFWCWLQWLADQQLSLAGTCLDQKLTMTDLAVGFAPDGFDAWEWQDLIAPGVRIGAPPDPLGRDGQDWGLPPFIPRRLDGVGYQPFAETLRTVLRHARGLRVDHVMGLFRLYWIPPGMEPSRGAYVHFVDQDLLHVLAIESTRAAAIVVGEDLGTVEPGVRDVLGQAGVLSTRLLWFEDQPPSTWPAQSMAAVTTHDLPTIAGVWSGADLRDLDAAAVTIPPDGDHELRHRLRVAASSPDDAATDQIVVAAQAAVAASPAMVATVALDDLAGAVHRPNVPGTIDQHPNWRIPLPVPLDSLGESTLANSVGDAMSATRARPVS